MKLDNLMISCHSLLKYSVLVFVLIVSACGTTQNKETLPTEPEQLVLVTTKASLPVREYDKEGNVVPFVAMPNPYLDIKGKIHKDAILNYIEARKALKGRNFDKAEALLKKVLEADKKLSGPWVMRGAIAEQRKAFEQAIKHYQQAIQVNKRNVNAYLPLAKLYRVQGRFVEAQNTYAEALSVWEDFPEAHLNLAVLYDIYLNDPLQAQQHMEAYQFLTEEKDAKTAEWLQEIQSRTGIAPNLYIGPSNTSQNDEVEGERSDV